MMLGVPPQAVLGSLPTEEVIIPIVAATVVA